MQDPHRIRYGVFGGTFNPVHVGHLALVHGVLELGLLDHLLIVPARLSPFKHERELLPAPLRLRMLQAVVAGLPGVSVSDMELRRPAPSYTIDTLAALETALPLGLPHLVMGMDTFSNFSGWRAASALLERTTLLLVGRAGSSSREPGSPSIHEPGTWGAALPLDWQERIRVEGQDRLVDVTGRAVVIGLSVLVPEVSSTEIRTREGLDAVPPAARVLLESFLSPPGR